MAASAQGPAIGKRSKDGSPMLSRREQRTVAEVRAQLEDNPYFNAKYDEYFKQPPPADLDMLFEAAKESLTLEGQRSERLDNKARGLATFTAAFVAAVQTFALRDIVLTSTGALRDAVVYVGGAAGVLLTVALLATAWATALSRDARVDPRAHLRSFLNAILEEANGKGDHRPAYMITYTHLAVAQVRAESNDRRAGKVAKAQWSCLATIVAAGVELVIALLVVL